MSLTTNFQPLYKQVYDLLTARLVKGEWKAAESLPSEIALAAELGVSQGTVRKALNQMVSEKLLERRQGKGTFVAAHTQESSLFRFFRMREPGGNSLIPTTQNISISRRKPKQNEQAALQLDQGVDVVELVRLRSLREKPTVLEKIIQPLSVFPDIDQIEDIPNSLYTLYQDQYGVSIVEVQDEVQAVNLSAEYAELLDLPAESSVLKVARSSISIDGRVVEWSEAYCSSEHYIYQVTIK